MAEIVSRPNEPPELTDIELTVIGPGYGESILVHFGGGRWIIVDSCVHPGTKMPQALVYLDSIGIDPTASVELVVATHWHDDHIAGMGTLANVCRNATFCCPVVLLDQEFRTMVASLKGRPVKETNRSVEEIHAALTTVFKRNSHPSFAIADRRIVLHGDCQVWALSPGDGTFLSSVGSVRGMSLADLQGGVRLAALSPNRASAVLWIEVGDVAVLLGADLPRAGWTDILRSRARPVGRASVIKVPHHGSHDAWEPRVWRDMATARPFAVLTPFTKGKNPPPTEEDLKRILAKTKNAYITADPRCQRTSTKSDDEVGRVLRQRGIRMDSRDPRPHDGPGIVRLRRSLGPEQDWRIEMFGGARSVSHYVSEARQVDRQR